jgi:hypothetical protein
MSEAIQLTTEQKLKLAEKALLATLKRIRDVKEVRYHLGAGCTTFELVTAAFSAIHGQPLDEVRNNISEGSAGICSSMQEILETL